MSWVVAVATLSGVAWLLREPIRNGLAVVLAGVIQDGAIAAEWTSAGANGFDVSRNTVGRENILSGGVARDGIPSVDAPVFVAPEAVDFLKDEDLVVSVTVSGVTRAYPLRILVWHEVVNDEIAGVPLVITYCPLCGSAMVFDRLIEDRVFTFGVSGLLYHSDVLLYDRETESLWSQLQMSAVSGEMMKAELPWRVSSHLTWAAWKARHPKGQVLSMPTGQGRDYSTPPYAGYEESPATYFPVPVHRDELATKTWVLGVEIGPEAKAYELSALPAGEVVLDIVGGRHIEIRFDPPSQEVAVMDISRNVLLPSVKVYWFAWQAFHPETSLWGGP